jgi:glutaredoxin-like YruB-family protein
VSLDTQILDQRQKLEALQSAFAQNGAQLTAEYQALDAQRKALKQGDTAAITKFNVAAADYQTRNQQRKQMQQDIDAGQKQLDALLDARSRAAATPKVLMYTTSHCPACKAAKQYLAQKGVPYQEIDVEQSRDGAEAFQKLGGRGVPLIMVGEKRMDGFNPQALEAVLAGA